jgi:hypothetical protein
MATCCSFKVIPDGDLYSFVLEWLMLAKTFNPIRCYPFLWITNSLFMVYPVVIILNNKYFEINESSNF